MKTPKEFNDLLKKKILTAEMLGACAYSVNKRAKNYRDKVDEYYSYYGRKKRTYIDSAKASKRELYEKKNILLSIVKPICIHRTKDFYYETHGKKWMDKNYDRTYMKAKKIKSGPLKDQNKFDVRYTAYEYFLYYEVGGFSFHRILDEKKLKEYPDLEIVDIGELYTEGKEINTLISVQFVDKVIDLIKSKEYEYVS